MKATNLMTAHLRNSLGVSGRSSGIYGGDTGQHQSKVYCAGRDRERAPGGREQNSAVKGD